jgi:hypothetical protein
VATTTMTWKRVRIENRGEGEGETETEDGGVDYCMALSKRGREILLFFYAGSNPLETYSEVSVIKRNKYSSGNPFLQKSV